MATCSKVHKGNWEKKRIVWRFSEGMLPPAAEGDAARRGRTCSAHERHKIYENLRVDLELGYIHLWLDKDTWGGYENYVGNTLNTKDAWKATVNVIYTF